MDNLVVQIIILAAGLGLIVFFGIRAVKDRKSKAKTKKSRSTPPTGKGLNTKR